jgi:hypothetical protein
MTIKMIKILKALTFILMASIGVMLTLAINGVPL